MSTTNKKNQTKITKIMSMSELEDLKLFAKSNRFRLSYKVLKDYEN